MDQDISLFPGARQLIRVTREWIEGKSDELKSETRYFITSLEREEKSAARLVQAIRGHWSVENKNHWKRDTSLWKEDASRPRKKASGGQVLALLRGAILRLHDAEAFESLNAGFHHHSAKPVAVVLCQALVCLGITLRMVEPPRHTAAGLGSSCQNAWKLTLETARWVFTHPRTLVVVVIGLADSGRRATVLSVKGLAFNLGYGLISLGFSRLLAHFPDQPPGAALRAAFFWQVPAFALVALLLFAGASRLLKRAA